MQPAQTFVNMSFRVLFVFTVFFTCGLGFTCLDANNNPVDWYSAYKTPEMPDSSDWKLKIGLAHFYLDVNVPEWQLSDFAMNETQQAVYATLNQVYQSQKEDDIMYVMYNDEEPGSKSSRMGHTKGVVAFSKTSGFWLIHSVPHFPAIKTDGYSWPPTACRNGQTFLCVSFKYEELGSISIQLQNNEANIYDGHLPLSIYQDFPILHQVISGAWIPGLSSIIQLTSLNGQKCTSFAKSSDFGQDLYADLVAPNLEQDLLVETWGIGAGGKLPSDCTDTYKVIDVNMVNIQDIQFKETRDHSKWAISFSNSFEKKKVLTFRSMKQWACIGDINRMKSQFKRGGGTLCLQNSSLWKAFNNSVGGYDSCSG